MDWSCDEYSIKGIIVRKLLRYLIGVCVIVAGISLWWGSEWLDAYQDPHIVQYVPQRDREAILQMFEEDWEWLVAQSPQEYSAAYRIDYKATSKVPSDINRLSIYVFRQDQRTVGFVAYYMNTFYKGTILFLAVHRAYRGQGISHRLLDYAVKKLEQQGARMIELVTRVDNYAAQHVYERAGFERIASDDTFVTYRYRIDS